MKNKANKLIKNAIFCGIVQIKIILLKIQKYLNLVYNISIIILKL